MKERSTGKASAIAKLIYLGIVCILVAAVLWPKPETQKEQPVQEQEGVVEAEEPASSVEDEEDEETTVVEPAPVMKEHSIESYPANRMTHYVVDGNDAGTCIAGRWCIGNQLSVADDTSVRYQGYYVFAVHCSVVKEWRGSIIKVTYTDGGVETGIVLDCGGFAGHKDRMDKAMGTRYNGKRDNYTLSRYIDHTEIIRKGW